MTPNTIYKTVCQYNYTPVAEADMRKFLEIAGDYGRVKNYVYQRYGGINGLPRIYPGYTVQNEMTKTGLRNELGLPSVYFYLAVFDALGDIKNQWTQTKTRAARCIRENRNLTEQEKHYLRFVMKQTKCFESILTGAALSLEDNFDRRLKEVSAGLDTKRLNRYLCRLVRRYLKKMHTDRADGFSITKGAYRYADHGIYISTKEARKRIFVPLTDNNCYQRQLYISLKPDEGGLIIHVPVEMKARRRVPEAGAPVGLAMGMRSMFVTDSGNMYGGKYGEYQFALDGHVRRGQAVYSRNRTYNPGRKKYAEKKKRLEAAMHTYINTEINRLLDTEKPGIVYVPKLPQNPKAGPCRRYNHSAAMWQRGYIRKRLAQKCAERSIELAETPGRDISSQCSQCGGMGRRDGEIFECALCGARLPERVNTARNVLKRGGSGKNGNGPEDPG